MNQQNQQQQPVPKEEQEDRRSLTKKWWDTLAPPFDIEKIHGKNETNEEPIMLEPTVVQNPAVTHFCFLVHGHRGCSKDLSYLQTIMQVFGERVKKKRQEEDESSCATTALADLVVHAAVCNEQKTNDGVEKGGERLAQEMISTIRHEMEKRIVVVTTKENEIRRSIMPQYYHVTISMVGNSLGGIYSRYAIAKLAHCKVLDDKYRLSFNVFYTTASPHLGISQHTYVPLPRSAEIGVAKALGTTGHDLFRLNDLMKTMATSEEFLEPLGRFRKRVAYANVYGTDFPVPPETAAFLNHNSTYPHYFVQEEEDDGEEDRIVVDDNGLIIATLHTPRHDPSQGEQTHQLVVDEEHEDELAQMSTALDSLGWKKVFVDIRSEIPLGVSLPWRNKKASNEIKRSLTSSSNALSERAMSFIRRSGLDSELVKQSGNGNDSQQQQQQQQQQEEEPQERTTEIKSLADLKETGEPLESRHVVSAFAVPNDNRLHLPVGHNMICAVSRSRISTLMNKGGRPVMDALAYDLVEDIFSWTEEEE